MNDSVDCVVIGGGATGAGIALDAALRGLSVVLVEQNDFGEGTSSRSTKLIHGGVRYLEAAVKHCDRGQWNLVREGLRERKIFLRNAAHLAHPIALITPLYHWWELPYVYAGLVLYDFISGRASLGRSRLMGPAAVIGHNQSINPDGLRGGVRYFDGAFDDARMVIALIQSAEEAGAYVRNHEMVTRLLKNPQGRLVGVATYDTIGDTAHTYFAKTIINATGPFVDKIRRMDQPNVRPLIAISSGVHIVLPSRFLPAPLGIMIPRTSDGRLIFALPYRGHCLVGTTDRPAHLAAHPTVSEEEVDFLLKHVNHYTTVRATHDDILGHFAGLRPLIAAEDGERTASLVRESVIDTSPSGLTTIAGGKWTAYRAMAQKVLDKLVARHPDLHPTASCTTMHHAVIGSRTDAAKIRSRLRSHPALAPLTEYLYPRYGDQSLRIAEAAHTPGDLVPLIEDPPITRAEIRYTLRHEYVRKPLDFLVRRSGLGLIDRPKARQLLPEILAVMREEFGWDRAAEDAMRSEAEKRLDSAI